MKYLWCVINYCVTILNADALPMLNIVGVFSDRDRAVDVLRNGNAAQFPDGYLLVNTTHHYRPRIVQVAADGGLLRTQWRKEHPDILARGIKITQPCTAYRPPSYSHTREVYFVMVPWGLRFFLSQEKAEQVLCGECNPICLGGKQFIPLLNTISMCILNRPYRTDE
jgi:hypothetical protein